MNKHEFSRHNSLCPLPWTGIYVDPAGQVKNCAISRTALGNVHDTFLPHILSNDVNTAIKQEMLGGDRHNRCTACYRVEDNAADKTKNESNRTWYKKIAIKNFQHFNQFDDVASFSPMILDLRWRNTCNQACVYCGPDLSSLWADSLKLDYRIDEDTLERSKSWIINNIHSVKHVYLAGGEPLLIKENQVFLANLLEQNPKVEIRVNTNLSVIDTPVFKMLEKFHDVKWTISVDSQKDCFEYMRWPGKWSNFLHNLNAVKKLVGDQINFNMVWCILNDVDILDTVDFLLSQGYHENMFIVQCLNNPFPLNIQNLPQQHKQDLMCRILSRQQSCNPEWWLYKSLQSMYNFLQQPMVDMQARSQYQDTMQLNPGLPGTFQYLEFIDRLHNTNSRKTFPRLYQLQ